MSMLSGYLLRYYYAGASVLVSVVHSALYATPTTLIELLNALSALDPSLSDTPVSGDIPFYGKDTNFAISLPSFFYVSCVVKRFYCAFSREKDKFTREISTKARRINFSHYESSSPLSNFRADHEIIRVEWLSRIRGAGGFVHFSSPFLSR